jgi:hypothetical protein
MINLLPPEEKALLSLETKKRLAIVIWSLFMFFVVCSILILLSIRFYLRGQVDAQKIILQEAEKRSGQSETQDYKEKFNSFNKTLAELNSFYNKKDYFYEILERTSRIIPEDAYLTGISANFYNIEGESPSIKVDLSGYIPNRERLFELKKIIEKEKDIKEVSFPPTNWVNPVDINFFINFKVPQK